MNNDLKSYNKFLEDFFIPPYVMVLVFFGLRIREVSNPNLKQLYCTAFGVLTYGFCVGNMADIYTTMLMKVTNIISIRITGPKRCHVCSLVSIFSMATLLRVMVLMGKVQISFLGDLIVLFLILKLVGFAFWINQQYAQQDDPNITVSQIVTLYDELSYYFSYCGMVVGPCISYPTYKDMLHMNSIRNENNIPIVEYLPSFFSIIYEDLFVFLYFGPMLLIAKSYVSYDYLTTDQFLYQDSILKKVWWITVCAAILKYRLYIAFIFSKWTCKGLGIGAYPVESKPKALTGPSINPDPFWKKVTRSQDISFVTINNISVYDMEFGFIYGNMVRHWNITVQSWLAHNIYRGLSFKRKSHGRMATFVVSAIWHGIYPGHYFTFGTAISLLSLEGRLVYFCNTHLMGLNDTACLLLKFLCWFLLNRLIDYAVIGFCLLHARPVINLWKSVYFYGHVGLFSLLFITLVTMTIPKNITHRGNKGASTTDPNVESAHAKSPIKTD